MRCQSHSRALFNFPRGSLAAGRENCSPVVVDPAVELVVAGEAGVGETGAANAALEAALVVRGVGHAHDVAIADGAAAQPTQRGQLLRHACRPRQQCPSLPTHYGCNYFFPLRQLHLSL